MNSTLIDWLIARMKEPSTYAGIFFIVRAFAPHLALTPDQIKSVEMIGESLAGLGLVLIHESSKTESKP